jgi:mannose-6-phosphate isomerase-like protein (cupin superfamily)
MADEKGTIDKVKNTLREPNIIEIKAAYSRHETITSPMIGAFGPKDIPGSNLSIGFAYITEPLFMIPDAHKHDFDQYLFFISGDSRNFVDFDAEIELTLDGEVKIITYPCYVFIPKGTMHCPLNIKRVTKPLVFIDARLTKEASVRPASSGTK